MGTRDESRAVELVRELAARLVERARNEGVNLVGSDGLLKGLVKLRQQAAGLIATWRRNWDHFTGFLKYPPELRKVVYTTNMIESLNARVRRATARRGHFPTEEAALKVVYLVLREHRPNRANITGRTRDWMEAANTLANYYGERVTDHY